MRGNDGSAVGKGVGVALATEVLHFGSDPTDSVSAVRHEIQL